MTTHPIPGQLFLLLTNDAGRQDSTSYRRQALAAAAITELMLYERLTLTEERSPKITVRDRTPLDLPVLDQALGALEELQGKALGSVIGHRSMDLTEVIGEGFAAVGAVQRKDLLRALGIAHRILRDDLPELSRRELDQRIRAPEVQHPAARAVKKLMDDMTAVMITTSVAT